jgi:hypothetical protein
MFHGGSEAAEESLMSLADYPIVPAGPRFRPLLRTLTRHVENSKAGMLKDIAVTIATATTLML